jgi:TolB protein
MALRKHIVLCVLFAFCVLVWPLGQFAHATEKQPMLAVIQTDGNLYIYDADGANPFPLTTDAQAGSRLYQWPTWATDGRIAFFATSVDPADAYGLRMSMVRDPKPNSTAEIVYTAVDDVFTYAYWAPGDCPASGGQPDCRELALLYTPPTQTGLAVKLIRVEGTTFSDRLIGEAAPFYYTFSPDGQKMLWHRFGSDLEIFDTQSEKTDRLDEQPGQFASPHWSPVDDRLLFAVQGAQLDESDLIVQQGEERRILSKGLKGNVSFAWSPQADKVAILDGTQRLSVVDANTGAAISQSKNKGIIAYFWSPDGTKIAYLNIGSPNTTVPASYNGNSNGSHYPQQTRQVAQWFVMEASTGTSTLLGTLTPTESMVYYLNFFDQFAHSHSLWSPDSRYFTYATVENRQVVLILADVATPANSKRIKDGLIGIWSW